MSQQNINFPLQAFSVACSSQLEAAPLLKEKISLQSSQKKFLVF